MTVFYFTSTGNSLAVAKKIGGNLVSIPQIVDKPDLHFNDHVIGIIFPIYSFGMPKMVRRFCEKANFNAEYMFIIGTCGGQAGAAMLDAQKLAKKNGYNFDYAKSLIIADNFLPFTDMQVQLNDFSVEKSNENISKTAAEIHARKKMIEPVSLLWRGVSKTLKPFNKIILNDKQSQKYIVDDKCNKCGVCKRVCPANNITITDKVTFSSRCEYCLACVHHCSKNALHLKKEKAQPVGVIQMYQLLKL